MDAILRRRDRSSWDDFLSSPSLFLARKIYAFLQRNPKPDQTRNRVRVVCISDTHNQHHSTAPLPEGDILVHAGDLTQSGSLNELEDALEWLSEQPHAHKFFIAGNHDACLADKTVVAYVRQTYPNLVYLEDNGATVSVSGRTLSVYGSPYTPRHGSWQFQYPRIAPQQTVSSAQWVTIPPHTDILITHGPPAYHLDNNGSGCAALLRALWRVRPLLHVFGHIHAARGVETASWSCSQGMYERVCERRGGWWNLLVFVAYVVIDYVRGPRSNRTTLANASAIGGFRDELKRGAVVVDI